MKELSIEQKAQRYDEALEKARALNSGEDIDVESGTTVYEYIFSELKESKSEKIRKALIMYFTLSDEHAYNEACGVSYKDILAWLEKQSEQKSIDKEYTFKSIPRLLDMIEPTDRAKSYCKKLIDSLQTEGYSIDAKIVGECLKQMNGEKVAMTVMDIGKQGEQKPSVVDFKAEDWYVSKVDGKIHNAKYMKKTSTNQASEKQSKPYGQREECLDCQFNYAGECKGSCAMKRSEQIYADKVGHLVPQKGEYYVCIKDYCLASNYLVNTKDKIYKSPCNGYINNDKGVGLSWISSCTEKYFRPIKEEDWIVCEQNNIIGKPLQYKEFMSELIQKSIKSLEDKSIVPNFRLWNISDAKDGDVLATSAGAFIYNGNNGGGSCPGCYCGINTLGKFQLGVKTHWTGKSVFPATKEQRDLLFQKMKEASYEWDAEKKEVRLLITNGGDFFESENCDQKPAEWKQENREELTDFENAMMHIGGSFFGENAGLDPNDTDTIKEQAELLLKLAPSKEWNEEDENKIDTIISIYHPSPNIVAWLKSLKSRVLPQPKQEWSEKDETKMRAALAFIKSEFPKNGDEEIMEGTIEWLKSIKQRIGWKPSDEQIEALAWALSLAKNCGEENAFDLRTLYEQLKKLKGE